MRRHATETPLTLSNTVLDTRFRSALGRMADRGRLQTYAAPVDVNLEIAGLMKKLDGGPAVLFSKVNGHDMPVIGNLLSCQANVEAAFGIDFRGVREFVGRALGDPKPPVLVERAPAQEQVHRTNIDLGRMLPALQHTAADAGRYVTAGIVIARDPETGVYNASYHRLMLAGPNRAAIQLDYGRHLRAAFERAQKKGQHLPVVVCIGSDLALHYTAATMGSQMPENADELAVAGGLCGRALPVVKAVSQDLLVPAESEIVLEGVLRCDEEVMEGPFGEFVGYLAPADPGPVLEVTAVTHRTRPIYHAINGYGRETVVLRKYVLEASLLKVLQGAVPIVTDAEMTAGGLHRFHAIVQVKKTGPTHDGLQRNAIMASFGALKDLDMVIVVDDDIDIRDPADVEYALATRMEASKDLFTIPAARGHEYVRVSDRGMRTKLGIDATVPFAEKARFARCEFKPVDIDAKAMTLDAGAARKRLDL
jgi:2,5-furandicarboxylate decarboxylase 1